MLEVVCVCALTPGAFKLSISDENVILTVRGTGLTKEADCSWCGPGKYQTGVGLMAEANCTWCVAGKYQSGSGLNAAF